MFVPIRGRPVPEVTWSKDDTNLKTRAHIDTTESFTLLVIPDCTRYDAGKYNLCLENVAGKKTGFVNVKVLDTPGPPVNLKPREITKNSITLQWEIPIIDGGSKIHNYIIEKRAATKKAYTVLSTTWQKCSFKFTDLEEGAYYYFRVSAENDLGVGEPAETPEPIRVSQAPSAPENLYVTDVTADSASLSWAKPLHDGGSLITGYVIEAQRKDTEQWVHVATIKALDFTVTDLVEGAEYTFRIMAVNASGRSDPRESRPAIIKEQTSAPSFDLRGVYQKTVIVKAGDRVKVEIPVLGKPRPVVSWKKGDAVLKETQRMNVETTATSTILNISEIKRTDGGQYSMTGKNMLGTVTETITVLVHDIPGPPTGPIKLDEVSCDYVLMSWEAPENDGVSGLIEDATYEFRVFARNSAGAISAPSQPSEAITCRDDIEEPRLDVDSSYSSNVVVMAGEIFKLEANVTGRPLPSLVWTKEGKELEDTAKLEIKSTDFHTTLINKDSLRRDGGAFTLTASNPGGFAKFIYNVKVLDRPGPPDSLTVTDVTAEKCVLNWLHPTHDGGAKIEYFIIQRRETSRLAWTNVATDLQANRFKVTKLLKGNEYIFRVMAVNKYGVGEPIESEPVICANPYTVSDPPQQPEVTTITKDSMVVCWERPEHDGGSRINTYVIERRDKTGLRWVKCNKRTVTDLRFKVSGLTPGHEYEYRILAENNAGLSQPSPSSPFYKAIDTIFQPGPPGNPRVLDTTKTSITLAWNKPVYDGGSEITGYIVETCLPEEDEWTIQTPKRGWTATSFTITNLKENQEYRINICATNCEGVGEPAAVPGTPKAEDRLLPPEIELGAELRKVVCIRACSTLRLFVPIKGRPAPEVKWSREHGESLDKANIEITPSFTTLQIENVDRFDGGKYMVTVENASGSKTAFVNVRVLDTPGAPQNLIVKEVTRDAVSLPDHDGGSRITGYIVEMQGKGSEKWTQVMVVKTNEAQVTGLTQGEEYMFRISATNEKGVSDPRPLSLPVVAKDLVIPPTFKLLFSTFSVLAGDDLKIDVPYTACPKATATWLKDGVVLKETTRVNAEATDKNLHLVIKESCRDDVGTYTIKLTNTAGEVTADSLVLSWNPPQ
uniref:Titin n=1 Tax=Salarias fasciatus TaxID=181472 RepID=A0A672I7Y2_SALFA